MQESEYHDLQIGNRHFKSADVCLTCHAHHKKQKQLIVDTGVKNTQARYCVFSGVSEETTQKAQNTDKENCISCHMPQVEGSHSDRVYAPTHASHRFAAISTKIEKPERFIDIDLKQAANAFTVTLKSNIPHDLVLHPTRLFVLKVFVNEKPVKEKEFKKPWKNGSYEPLVWLKENIVYKENLNAKSKLAIEVPHKIKKGDEVRVELGYYVFNPKLAKKIGLEDEKSTRYRVFVQKKFNIP